MKLKSRRLLVEAAAFHKLSGRALAKKANLSPAIVNHLMHGRRTSCNWATARAIEEALQLPSGFLFEAKLSPVADSKQREGSAA